MENQNAQRTKLDKDHLDDRVRRKMLAEGADEAAARQVEVFWNPLFRAISRIFSK